MSRSTAFYGLLITTVAALAIGIAALVVASITAANLSSGSEEVKALMAETILGVAGAGGGAGGRGSHRGQLLSIYDNRSQSLAGPNTWTNVAFNNHVFGTGMRGAWLHDVGSDTVVCNRTGFYTAYFSVQAQINTNAELLSVAAPHVKWECKACNLRYSIRGTRQEAGDDFVREIPGSLTYSGGQAFYMAKLFLINATAGDAFRFQFVSPCSDLALQPFPYVMAQPPTPVADSFPSSTTLVITM